MGLRDRLQEKALRVGAEALKKTATSVPAQMAGDGLRGFRGMLDGGEESLSVEFFLLSMVRAVRDDELEDDRSRREVYVTARKRRRRLALAAIALGPFAAAANQVADLYCEAAVICDLADFHEVELTDDQVAAHMLVLWEVAGDLATAERAIAGNPPVADLLGERLFDEFDERLPEDLTRRSIAKALWDVRDDVNDLRKSTMGDAVRVAAFTGSRTRKVIERIEGQLGIAVA
ncbi:MAG TPA: hypothetical protein VF245_09520 [Solirubrobacterales bacterium]